MMTSPSDAIAQTERALLGSILLTNLVWTETAGLSSEDFFLGSHRDIFAHIAAMFEDQRPVDCVTLTMELAQLNKLDRCGGPEYIGSLMEVCIPENIKAYVRAVRAAAQDRRVAQQLELMTATRETNSPESGTALRKQADRLQQLLSDEGADYCGWKNLFHSYEEIINAPAARFAIDGFLQEEGITLIGGLAGHGKTLCMLAMVRALLEGGKLFHHFAVTKPAERVIYLIPEAGLGPFSARLKTFHLQQHIRDERLYCRTLSAPHQLALTDPRLLSAVKGANVFLDTAIRFMVGDENSAAEQKVFAETLFSLQRAGARTITGAHHSPKSFGKDSFMTLENVLRGSGDIGAMLTTCWGLSQVDAASNRIYIQNVKARDFSPCESFVIEGRPSLDETGFFGLTHPPGFSGHLSDHKTADRKPGRPEMPQKDEKRNEALRLYDRHQSIREISKKLGVGKTTVASVVRHK